MDSNRTKEHAPTMLKSVASFYDVSNTHRPLKRPDTTTPRRYRAIVLLALLASAACGSDQLTAPQPVMSSRELAAETVTPGTTQPDATAPDGLNCSDRANTSIWMSEDGRSVRFFNGSPCT